MNTERFVKSNIYPISVIFDMIKKTVKSRARIFASKDARVRAPIFTKKIGSITF